MMPLAPFDLGQRRRHDVGFGLALRHVVGGGPGVGEGFAVDEVEERLDVLGLAGAGQDQAEPALLDLGQQLVRAFEGLDLSDELVELLHPRLAQVVPVRLLDLPAGDLGHEHVPAHSDAAVDAPHRQGDAVAAEGAEPRQGVLVVGVYESAVDVEDRGVCHGPCLPRREIVMRCGDENLASVQAPAVAPTGPDSAGVLHTPWPRVSA
jgi:hypothetical protein